MFHPRCFQAMTHRSSYHVLAAVKNVIKPCSLFLCLLVNTAAVVSGAEYEVDGQIDQTIFKQDGTVQKVRKATFTVFVSSCSWLIQTIDLDNSGKPIMKDETACTNGQVIYEVDELIANDAARNGRGPRNFAYTWSNNIPVGQSDDYFVCHTWLMFASGCYFQNLSTNKLTPVYDYNASVVVNPGLKRKAKWELSNGPGSLPSKVIYYRDNYASVTDATYIATGFTNAGRVTIPSGFVFELNAGLEISNGRFLPIDTNTTSRIRKRAVGTVTAVRPYCSRKDLIPMARGLTMFNDQRLGSATNRLHYRIQDGVRWVSVEEAKKLVIQQSAKPKPLSRGIVAIMLLLPTAAFILFLWLNRKKG